MKIPTDFLFGWIWQADFKMYTEILRAKKGLDTPEQEQGQGFPLTYQNTQL